MGDEKAPCPYCQTDSGIFSRHCAGCCARYCLTLPSKEAARQKITDDVARFLAAGRNVTVVATDDYDHDAKHLTVSDHAKNGWENRRKGGD